MGRIFQIGVVMLALASMVRADRTITATFENYSPEQAFQPSFTDSLSGITFRNSTNPPSPGGFVIDNDLDQAFFGGSNYLTASGGPNDSLGVSFGFTADLPAAVDKITLDAIYHADVTSNVALEGFNSGNVMVAQATGPAGSSSAAFHLEIDSSQFNITTFRVVVGSGAAGYDNISYTIAPEPNCVLLIFCIGTFLHRRKPRL